MPVPVPTARDPHVRVAPLTIVIVPVACPPAAPVTPDVMAPLTVRLGEPLAAKVNVPLPLPLTPIEMLAHAASVTLTVTVNPPSIVTTSPATGKLAPLAPPEVADQTAVLFQLPVATEKRFAAIADVTPRTAIERMRRLSVVNFFMSDLSKGVLVFA